MSDFVKVETLLHGEQLFADLLGRIRADHGLVQAMWEDAESRPDELDAPGTHWTVALLVDGTPGAWCAARMLDDGRLKCHSNFEPPLYRGRGLYEAVYHARHFQVVRAYAVTAVTYLFPEPIRLHEVSGWRKTGETGPGELGPHQWWEMEWRPPARR